jgi:FtsZ-binding cell division protein ZapB
MNEEIDILKLEIEELKKKNNELEEKLKLYTNPERNKKYYEKNSNVVKEKAKTYMEKMKETNPEKLKEWHHNAYLKRKEKLKQKQKEEEKKDNNIKI